MRREQLGELVNLTSTAPTQRRTAEMPAVELVDLLRKDRELEAAPAATPDHVEAVGPYEEEAAPAPVPTPLELAAGTVRIARPSDLKLVLGCIAAFAGGFALTSPLWW